MVNKYNLKKLLFINFHFCIFKTYFETMKFFYSIIFFCFSFTIFSQNDILPKNFSDQEILQMDSYLVNRLNQSYLKNSYRRYNQKLTVIPIREGTNHIQTHIISEIHASAWCPAAYDLWPYMRLGTQYGGKNCLHFKCLRVDCWRCATIA